MRPGISIILSPADRRRLEALVGTDVAQKHVWRARIVLHSADGIGTNAPDRQVEDLRLALAGALRPRGLRVCCAKRRLKRGVFRSIVDLQVAINRFLDETNDNPKPFTWTADPDKIIAAVKRGHQVLDSIH